MTTDRDRILSEFIAAWTAGQRPSVQDHLDRIADETEREDTRDAIHSFLGFAPLPDYDDAALQQLRKEPIVVEALGAARTPGGLFAARLARLRSQASLSTRDLAARLSEAFGFSPEAEQKAARYLDDLESGALAPARVQPSLIDALASALRTPVEQLRAAASFGAWAQPSAAPAMLRSENGEGADFQQDLELLADAVAAPSERDWDQVDELFRGG